VVGEAAAIGQLAVAAIYGGLAALLVYLNFPNNVYRSMALVLGLRGFTVLLNQLVVLDPANALLWHNYRSHFFIATTFAVLDLLTVYTWRSSSTMRRSIRRILLATFLLVEGAFIVDHSIVWTFTSGTIRYGAWGAFATAFPLAMALAACWFAFLARRLGDAAQARFHRLLALGFALAGLAERAGQVSTLIRLEFGGLIARTGDAPGAVAAQLVALAAIPMGLLAVAILVSESIQQRQTTRAVSQALLALLVIMLPLVTGLLSGAQAAHGSVLFSAVPRVLAAAILAYSILRQTGNRVDIFRLDLAAGLAIQRGTVGGILVAFFFVVSESAAQIIARWPAAERLGPNVAQFIGIFGAAVLLVFLQPLNQLGQRLAHGAIPASRPLSALSSDERLGIYREQVGLAWADGSITRKERLLLDQLRQKLGLALADAVRLESIAAHGIRDRGSRATK
jgi:hypothetical protein